MRGVVLSSVPPFQAKVWRAVIPQRVAAATLKPSHGGIGVSDNTLVFDVHEVVQGRQQAFMGSRNGMLTRAGVRYSGVPSPSLYQTHACPPPPKRNRQVMLEILHKHKRRQRHHLSTSCIGQPGDRLIALASQQQHSFLRAGECEKREPQNWLEEIFFSPFADL